jgi:hypothetical protein
MAWYDELVNLMPTDATPHEPTQWNGQDNRPMESALDPTPEERQAKARRVLMEIMEDYAIQFGGWKAVHAALIEAMSSRG